jgi:uncharacterized membrane protein
VVTNSKEKAMLLVKKVKSILSKASLRGGVVTAVLLPAFYISPLYAAGRILQSQGQYIGAATTGWITAVKAILFMCGLGMIGFAGVTMFKDYVLATSDHEKKFSIGSLLVGIIIGGLLCLPFGAIVIGSDILGTSEEVQATQGDFQR